MHREGHAGLSFVLFSPFLLLFKILSAETSYLVMTGILIAGLSSLPDLDLEWEIKHRGITHTVVFGMVLGILFAFLFGYSWPLIGWFIGFSAGFGSTASHLIGDSLTYMPFQPFYPFSKKKVSYGLFKASNQNVNFGLLIIGLVLFVICLEPSIITSLFQ